MVLSVYFWIFPIPDLIKTKSLIFNSRNVNFPIKIKLVVSNNPKAPGLLYAKKYSIPILIINTRRRDHENIILKEMVNGIKDALESTPPELSADLVDMGLTLTGGGALLKNIDKRFSKETGLPVHIADEPLSCVAIGTGRALDQEQTFSTMLTEY